MLSAEEIELKKREFWKDILRINLDTVESEELIKDRDTRFGITCAECELNDKCEFAWDFYNTNGDCLAEK